MSSQNQQAEVLEIKKTCKSYGYSIDHDHKTGFIRGILCLNCNSGLGRFKDNKNFLFRAIEYLMKGEIIS